MSKLALVLCAMVMSMSAVSFAGEFECDEQAYEKAMKDLGEIDHFQGDLVLLKGKSLKVIRAYTLSLKSFAAKEPTEKNRLMMEAMEVCDAPTEGAEF